ncbi:MAG: hypothetical protein R2854_20705 [Caldilineaceae bacterium]
MLMDNNGYRSIGALSRSLGQKGFGTRYVFPEDNVLPTETPAMQAWRRCRWISRQCAQLGRTRHRVRRLR